jgi:hypothetical protein
MCCKYFDFERKGNKSKNRDEMLFTRDEAGKKECLAYGG